ncbi:hypothetical protein ACL9RL_07365 [Plantibacter sp. Mn2098]|uniref:hypothetical protein n=1 Tax=Plantibacter sp. Mn2098 TaxID=3395266 RepID=UPI003BE0199A
MSDPNVITTPASAAPQPTKSNRPLLLTVIILSAVVLIGIVAIVWTLIASQVTANQQYEEKVALRDAGLSAFEDATSACNISGTAPVSDGGETLALEGKGKKDFDGLPFERTQCVLTALGAPSRVTTLMGETRALDGRQLDSWDRPYGSIDVTWTYHPDAGLDALLTLQLDPALKALDEK